MRLFRREALVQMRCTVLCDATTWRPMLRTLHDSGERSPGLSAGAGTLADQHHALALIIAVLKPAPVLAIGLPVLRADVTAEISAADALPLPRRGHRLTDLMPQDEGGFVPSSSSAAVGQTETERRDRVIAPGDALASPVLCPKEAPPAPGALAFDFVAENSDGGEVVADRQLVMREHVLK